MPLVKACKPSPLAFKKAADDMCGDLSIAHRLRKGKKKFDGVLKNFRKKFAQKILLWPKTHFYFQLIYNFYHFLYNS